MPADPSDIWAALAAPFGLDDLEWRVGATNRDKTSGMCLIYVTNRSIQQRLDDVMGPPNWRPEFLLGRGKSVLCGLSLRVDGEWITKWDGAEETDTEPVKGGISGAMKRAAVQWGLGRTLYAMPDIWGPLEAAGKSWRFPRDWRPPIPAAFLPDDARVRGSVELARAPWPAQGIKDPSPAASPPSRPKPAPKPKAPQAKPQAVSGKPGDIPRWDDFRMELIEYGPPYGGMSWVEAWDMDKGLFFDWTKEKYQEIADDIADSSPRRDASEEEKRVKAAKLHLETLMRSKPK